MFATDLNNACFHQTGPTTRWLQQRQRSAFGQAALWPSNISTRSARTGMYKTLPKTTVNGKRAADLHAAERVAAAVDPHHIDQQPRSPDRVPGLRALPRASAKPRSTH